MHAKEPGSGSASATGPFAGVPGESLSIAVASSAYQGAAGYAFSFYDARRRSLTNVDESGDCKPGRNSGNPCSLTSKATSSYKTDHKWLENSLQYICGSQGCKNTHYNFDMSREIQRMHNRDHRLMRYVQSI